jgi:hypothetical protein
MPQPGPGYPRLGREMTAAPGFGSKCAMHGAILVAAVTFGEVDVSTRRDIAVPQKFLDLGQAEAGDQGSRPDATPRPRRGCQ